MSKKEVFEQDLDFDLDIDEELDIEKKEENKQEDVKENIDEVEEVDDLEEDEESEEVDATKNNFDDDIDTTDENDYSEDKEEKIQETEESLLNTEVKKWTSQKIWEVTKTVSKKWKITYAIDVSEQTYQMFVELRWLLEEEAKKNWDVWIEATNDKIISTCILSLLNELSPEQD